MSNSLKISGEGAGDITNKVKDFVIKVFKKIIEFIKSVFKRIKILITGSGDAEDEFEKALDAIPKVLSAPKKTGTKADEDKVYNYRSIENMTINGENSIISLLYQTSTYGQNLLNRFKAAVDGGYYNKYLDRITDSKWKNEGYTINDLKKDQSTLDDSFITMREVKFTDEREVPSKQANKDTGALLKEYLNFKSKYYPQDMEFKVISEEFQKIQKELENKIKNNQLVEVANDPEGKLTMKAANFLQQAIQTDIQKFSFRINEYNKALRITVGHIKELSAIYLQTNFSSFDNNK